MSARRQGQSPLTRQRIVEAAIAIVDAEGLDALSMRKLGAGLGVDASSIYYHVSNKSALYDLVVDAVMSEVDLDPARAASTAHERLLAVMRSYRDALLAHPAALPLLGARPLVTHNSLVPAEYALGALHDAGLDYQRATAAVNSISYFVLGAAIAYANHTRGADYSEDYDESRYADLPTADFPHTLAAVESGRAPLEFEDQFELGARALVDGLLGMAADAQ